MSEVFRCDDKDTLVAYLYGEVDQGVRREVERHLRTCPACTRETEGLQAVRQDLQAWLPPEPELGFSIVARSAQPAAVLTSPRWAMLREVPVWARAAAAALVVGVSLGLANLHVRSTADGFVVTTGWMSSPALAPAPVAAVATRPGDDWRRELAALEQTMRREMAVQHAAVRAVSAPRSETGGEASAILRRVQTMINESEERQRQEIAAKLIQADRFWNVRRQNDLVNVQRTLGTLQNRNIAVQVNQQEAINQLKRVSLTPPNQ